MSWLGKLFRLSRGPNWNKVDWMRLEADWQMADHLWRSSNQADKKQAVIQADSAFDRLLIEAGLEGGSMGERLKGINRLLDWGLYNRLWEAHKKRNELVHETGSFVAYWDRTDYPAIYRQAAKQLRFGK